MHTASYPEPALLVIAEDEHERSLIHTGLQTLRLGKQMLIGSLHRYFKLTMSGNAIRRLFINIYIFVILLFFFFFLHLFLHFRHGSICFTENTRC